MAINVIVIRPDGDKPGHDIIDPLCCTESVAIQRGTQYIDEFNKNRLIIRTTGPLRTWITPGSLVEILDSELISYRALVTAIAVSIIKEEGQFTADVNLTLERISE